MVAWLKDLSEKGKIGAKEMAQGLGRLGFAAIALDWERPFLGPLHAWSSAVAVQGKVGLMTVPTMVRVLAAWLAGRLAGGDRLQRPSLPIQGQAPMNFYTDAKAEDERAWVGGFLEVTVGGHCPWFSLEVKESWAPWAFAKGSPKKTIAALELLATLIAVKLWVPASDGRQISRVAIRGYTDNKSNEALVKKAMTTQYPSGLILMELAEELASKDCELQLAWIRRDLNQLADDLTNEEFKMFDMAFRIPLKGEDLQWKILDQLLGHAKSYFEDISCRKRKAELPERRFRKRARKLDPW